MATVDALLDEVKDMVPTIQQHREEAEQARRLSHPVVDAMGQAGLYRMARPRAFSGLELDPVSMFRVVEEVARHDSAAGWTLQLSVVVDPCLAWLPDAGAAEILDGHMADRFVERMLAAGIDAEQILLSRAPLKRRGTPEEIAEAAVWPCSDAASYVTGHAMVVDGGFMAI
jgi:hypothetical protein